MKYLSQMMKNQVATSFSHILSLIETVSLAPAIDHELTLRLSQLWSQLWFGHSITYVLPLGNPTVALSPVKGQKGSSQIITSQNYNARQMALASRHNMAISKKYEIFMKRRSSLIEDDTVNFQSCESIRPKKLNIYIRLEVKRILLLLQ